MKICLAGTGARGEIHVKARAKINDVQVVSVAGRTEEGVKEFATKWNIPFAATALKACMDRPGVGALTLTTPSDHHADQTTLARSMGKHVQVEIPMALSLKDSQRMLDASKAAGKAGMVKPHRRVLCPP